MRFVIPLLAVSLLAGCRSVSQHTPVSQATTHEDGPQRESSQQADAAKGLTSDSKSPQATSIDESSSLIPVAFAEPGPRVTEASENELTADVAEATRTATSGPHTLDHYLAIARSDNPRLLAARQKVAALMQVRAQVESLDDPMLNNTVFPITDNGPQTAAGRAPYALMVSQKFPWEGKLETKGAIAAHDVQIAVQEFNETQLDIDERVKLAYFEVAYSQRAIAIVQAARDYLVTRLLPIAQARFRTGGSQQDVILAQLEVDQLDDRLIQLKKMLLVAQSDLVAALNASQDDRPEAAADEKFAVNVPQELDRLYEIAAQNRPELRKWLHAIAKEQHAEELACLNYFPDITTGVTWQAITQNNAISPVSNSRDNIGVTLGFNLPIWREKLDAAVVQTQHRQMEMSRRYDASKDETFRQIRGQIVRLESLQQQKQLYRKEKTGIIARSKQVLQISIADYRVNKVDFQQVIDNWTNLLMFELQAIRIEANITQALARLERAVGFGSESSDD